VLALKDLRLTSESAEVVGWLMRQNRRLEIVDLTDNPIGARGAACVARALPQSAVRQLLLSGTTLCDTGGTDQSGLLALARGVALAPALQTLELRDNQIGARACSLVGLRALAAALKGKSCTVTKVDLSHNPLQSRGATVLASVILDSPTLLDLRLDGCRLTGDWGLTLDGVRAIACALALNTALEHLSLAANAVGRRSSEAVDQWKHTPCAALFLASALERNATLLSCNLRANHCVGSQAEALLSAWAKAEREPAKLQL
jgi:Ran GTPase-activating protein (RanGAP) involved in mRNA processing and transport